MTKKRALIITLGVIFTLLAAAVLFSPVLALLGDINLDDLVDSADLDAIAAKFGLYQSDPGFDEFLNLNLDYYIDVKDLAIAGRSYGSTRNFHYPRRIANSTKSVIYQSSCIDASDRIQSSGPKAVRSSTPAWTASAIH